MSATWDELTVDGSTMRCYRAMPNSGGPLPAVVVIQHASGVDNFIQNMTDRVAEAGFAGLAPDLYHREAPGTADDGMTRMGRLRDANIVRDVGAAIDHAKTIAEIRGERIGITGFCMGGRVAYLMATQRADLRAAVVFYGGNIMVPWGQGQAPFDRSEGIGCPVLGLFGTDDGNPSPADVAKLDAELKRLGKEHEFHSYAGAAHAFMTEGRPSYRADAAADAWKKCIAWFERHLK